MTLWTERILGHFTAELTRLWVACDPDEVLLDEKLLTGLRGRGFELMLYEDPFAFRAEYEERYRAAWDREARAAANALRQPLVAAPVRPAHCGDHPRQRVSIEELIVPFVQVSDVMVMGAE